jgi:hypothetical protein
MTEDGNEEAVSAEQSADDPARRSGRRWFAPGSWQAGVVVVRCSSGALFEDLWIP